MDTQIFSLFLLRSTIGLTLGSINLALGYVFIQQGPFAETTVPLSENAVMQAMTELRALHYGYWVYRYGMVFILGSFGFVGISFPRFKRNGLFVSIPLALFTLFSCFWQPLDKLWGEP